jgi:hypothetical protein
VFKEQWSLDCLLLNVVIRRCVLFVTAMAVLTDDIAGEKHVSKYVKYSGMLCSNKLEATKPLCYHDGLC